MVCINISRRIFKNDDKLFLDILYYIHKIYMKLYVVISSCISDEYIFIIIITNLRFSF